MKKSTYSVAVVGASGLVGAEIVTVLAERQFPLADLRLYASARSAGDEVRCGRLRARIELLEGARFTDTDLVFLAAGEQISAEWVGRATEHGAVVIDCSQLLADDADVPLVVPEVNAADVAGFRSRGAVTSPDAPAIALAVALKPLEVAVGIARLVATTFEPVAGAGRAGLDELQQQTLALMSGQSAEERVFPQRIAFNVLPQVGELLAGGVSRDEQQTIDALRRLLGTPELTASVTRARVPLFFGGAVSANIETTHPLPAAQTRELLHGAPGVLLEDTAAEPRYATPADAVGQDATLVGRIREIPSANAVDLWIAFDNIRKGSAVNAVQIAEILVRDHL